MNTEKIVLSGVPIFITFLALILSNWQQTRQRKADTEKQREVLSIELQKVRDQADAELKKASLAAQQERERLQQESRSRDLALAETIRDELREDILRERLTHREELASQEAQFQAIHKSLREDRDMWKDAYSELWHKHGELQTQFSVVMSERDDLKSELKTLSVEVAIIKRNGGKPV